MLRYWLTNSRLPSEEVVRSLGRCPIWTVLGAGRPRGADIVGVTGPGRLTSAIVTAPTTPVARTWLGSSARGAGRML